MLGLGHMSLRVSVRRCADPMAASNSKMSPRKRAAAVSVDLDDVLVRKRVWNGEKWSAWEVLLRRSSPAKRACDDGQQKGAAKPEVSKKVFKLPLGGTLIVYPNLLSKKRQCKLKKELFKKKNSKLFRQYRIQNNKEPRAHFLLHSKATDDGEAFESETTEQPGYCYGTISMKAKPLSLLPRLRKFAREMKQLCRVKSWNIGVNPVFYRDSRDHINLHADNNQGEDKILTVLVASPDTPRKIVVQTMRPKGTTAKQDGDEQYELFIGAGDGYDMDGVMQKYYVHGVLGDSPGSDGRLAIVFRHGKLRYVKKDSGSALENLDPRPIIPTVFGQMCGLVEGDSYSRTQMRDNGFHQ